MAAQDEREPGVMDMGEGLLDPMAQVISIPEQDIVVEEQFFPPQMDPEPEMGVAAAGAAVHDTSLPLSTKTPRPWPNRLSRLRSTWPS